MAKAVTKKSAQARNPARRKARDIEVRATIKSSGVKKQGSEKARKARSTAKTLMGISVPTGLSNALESLVNSPRGRKLLASALVAAAGAAAAALTNASADDERDDRETERGTKDTRDPLETATKDLSMAAAGALAEVATGAVQSLLPTSLGGGSKSKARS